MVSSKRRGTPMQAFVANNEDRGDIAIVIRGIVIGFAVA